MPFLPKQLTTLVGQDSTLGRVTNHVRAAVQPTLDFLNTFLQAGPDGSLQILRNIVAQAALSVTGPSYFASVAQFAAALYVYGPATLQAGGVSNNDFTINNGNLFVKTRTANGVVFVPFTPSTPVFYTTNTSNTAALFIIYGDGTVIGASPWTVNGLFTANASANFTGQLNQTGDSSFFGNIGVTKSVNVTQTLTANSVVSAQGFVHKLPPVYLNGHTVNGADPGLIAGAALPAQFYMERSGSITGVYLSVRTTTTGSSYAQILKNGTAVLVSSALTNSTTQAFVNNNYAKGTYSFVTGDVLKINFYSNAATGVGSYYYGYIYLTVEYSS